MRRDWAATTHSKDPHFFKKLAEGQNPECAAAAATR
jgi:hypothetical protein